MLTLQLGKLHYVKNGLGPRFLKFITEDLSLEMTVVRRNDDAIRCYGTRKMSAVEIGDSTLR